MSTYWATQVEAEQLREDNVEAPRLLLQKYGYLVNVVTAPEGTYLLYEQRSGPRLIRGFIRPGQWVQVTTTASGESLVKAKDGPPAGPPVTT